MVAAFPIHSVGNIEQISLFKSTALRHRASARLDQAVQMKNDFNYSVGQISFDGKLLLDLCISKTEDSTENNEANMVKETLYIWKITEKSLSLDFTQLVLTPEYIKEHVKSYNNFWAYNFFGWHGMLSSYPGASSWCCLQITLWRNLFSRSYPRQDSKDLYIT